MEQNPYCNNCHNSFVVRKKDDGTWIGICDKCSIINVLSEKETENYLHNEKCKTRCSCGGTAYVHNNDDYYHCFCCFEKIALGTETKLYLEKYKKSKIEIKNKEDDELKKFKQGISKLLEKYKNYQRNIKRVKLVKVKLVQAKMNKLDKNLFIEY